MADRIRIYFREPTIDTNRPISSGHVRIEGFETEITPRLEEADAWDCGFAARMLDFEAGPACVSIPAFPNRKFRLSYIFVNSAAGVESPRDLEGKRVGIRFWANTAGVWARAAIRHQYGVNLERIRWRSAQPDGSKIPPGAIDITYLNNTPQDPLLVGAQLDALLVAGELDAVMDADVPPSITRKDGRTRRLFGDYVTEEKRYFQETGVFPISHLVTIRREFVDRHPEAPMALLRAFRSARDQAVEAIDGSDPQILLLPWLSHYLEQQRLLMGEPYFAYDVEHNVRSLQAMMQYAHEQWLTSRRMDFHDLFDERAAADPDQGVANA